MKTKCVTQHTANNAYVLNTHSLHNYLLISAVIPPEIHVQMASPQIPNHEEIRLNGAKHVRQTKKAEDNKNATAAPISIDIACEGGIGPVTVPAFDRTTKSTGRKGKGKTVAKGKKKGPATIQSTAAPSGAMLTMPQPHLYPLITPQDTQPSFNNSLPPPHTLPPPSYGLQPMYHANVHGSHPLHMYLTAFPPYHPIPHATTFPPYHPTLHMRTDVHPFAHAGPSHQQPSLIPAPSFTPSTAWRVDGNGPIMDGLPH